MKDTIKNFFAWMKFNPPSALPMGEWGKFKDKFQTEAPIRYFLAETVPDFFMPVKWKIQNIMDWIRYRIVRYHIVDTGLKPDYYECDTLILHSSFNLLKDFVEVQKGWMYYWCHDDEIKLSWKERFIPFYRRLFYRRPDLGIKYLEWETTLDGEDRKPSDRNPDQAEKARKILELYRWWVDVRPKRKDIDFPEYDDQGMYMGCLNENFDDSAPDFKAQRKAWKYQEDMEEKWHEEDEKMLIELIKIRRGLWT